MTHLFRIGPPAKIVISGREFTLTRDEDDSSFMYYVNDDSSVVGAGFSARELRESLKMSIMANCQAYSTYADDDLTSDVRDYIEWLRVALTYDLSFLQDPIEQHGSYPIIANSATGSIAQGFRIEEHRSYDIGAACGWQTNQNFNNVVARQ